MLEEVLRMATVDQSLLLGKTRDRPIGQKLTRVLVGAADAAGVDTVMVTSGSQPGTHGRRTGSTRHDNGRAADLHLVKGGRALTFTDHNGGPIIEAFVTAAAAYGANGIGAGVRYMGNKTLHVGFGLTPHDHRKLVWGFRGRSANAPAWLRRAAKKGWNNPLPLPLPLPVPLPAPGGSGDQAPGRFVVIARSGLHLRKGPGLGFGISTTVDAGTELDVLDFDDSDSDWAKVDLQGDGLIDGFMFAAFLGPTEDAEPDDAAADIEPDEDEEAEEGEPDEEADEIEHDEEAEEPDELET